MDYYLTDKILKEVYPDWKSQHIPNFGMLRNTIAKHFSEFAAQKQIDRNIAKKNLRKLQAEIFAMHDPTVSSDQDQYRIGFNNCLYIIIHKLTDFYDTLLF